MSGAPSSSLRLECRAPRWRLVGAVALSVALWSAGTQAQSSPAQPAPQPAGQPANPDQPTFRVRVIETTPLPGLELPIDEVPAPVQTATAAEVEQSGALDLSDFLNRRIDGVHVNEMQNNPFQVDVNYRGYTASPLLGTPQGLSVYVDGVRFNQPFGEVVSWDLIPRIAIARIGLMPGSNPAFGLNTLGGALALETKDGRSASGTHVQALGGSSARRSLEFEHGGATPENRFHWYLAGSVFGEDGWRDDSPSDVRQLFGKVGWERKDRQVTVSVGFADNALTGNGLQDVQLLERDDASVYTKPDTTDNRSTLLNVSGRQKLAPGLELIGHVYYRDIRTRTLNGDINEESLDQSLYQPGAAERAALAAAGYGAIPSSGLNADNTPFPSLRCVGNALLNDEPSEKCNGLINRSRTTQHNGGLSAQLAGRRDVGATRHAFTLGGAFDRSHVDFGQTTELGYLNPDRSVTGVGAFGDGGLTGGDADGVPYDTRVDLDGRVTTFGLFAADTLTLRQRFHVSVSGRVNRVAVDNRDRITPGGGPGSLDGEHVFTRFNPAAGLTVDLRHGTNVFVGYSEGSRAATSIELGCADPEQPCKLPNAMAGDPPLRQVVTHTIEAGVRGGGIGLAWNAGVFRADNDDDILFVMSEQTGFGYFRNFGQTRRAGLELGVDGRRGRVTFGADYTLLNATFQSEETVNGESNSTNEAALDGVPGVDGTIDIEPGNRMPLVPRHVFKAFVDVDVTDRLSLDLGLVGTGGAYARGNENNEHEPDGVYYLGEGGSDGYAVVNLGGRYRLTSRLHVIGRVDNLFDREYATAAQLGPAGFTATGTFIARPLPAIAGEFPVRQTTFLAPGAPRRAWAGVQVRF